MNSPSHYRPVNHHPQPQNRFFSKKNSNVINHNPPIYSLQNIPNHTPTNYKSPRISFEGPKPQQVKLNETENTYKTTVRNIYDRNIVNSALIPQHPKMSDTSNNSLNQTEDDNTEIVNNRIKDINQQLSAIFSKLTSHDNKFQQINQRIDSFSQASNKKLQIIDKMQQKIWREVAKQVGQNQHHMVIQNKLMKADLDTLKLQILCYAQKKELKSLNQKIQDNQKLIRQAIKQVKQSNSEETHRILQRRKTDISRFQKQVQQMKSKMMDIVFSSQKAQHTQQFCLVKCLSFKVLHEMKVYNQGSSEWIDLGTGQSIYSIDQQGYLLDNQNKYITDKNDKLVKLDPNHIELLRKHGLTR